ncbi:MAG TPA: hypothetical protein VGM89_05715, partial [Puia sp.]
MSVLVILGIFLSLYFLKYVPEHKRDYNQRAFQELRGVTEAFVAKANAWLNISTFTKKSKGPLPIDSMLLPLTAGDKDVFDHYLVIQDTGKLGTDSSSQRGALLFNPDHLSISYSIATDSLLKKSDGFSITNIRDVKIEGNDYKLFLYPFCLQNSKAIMAGLLSQSRYTSRYESVPIDFITTGAILLLLILITIPLLKVYIIGSHERITNLDLRLIIGTYYIGGFVLYFLLLWNFLEGSQIARNHRFLTQFTRQLNGAFNDEIRLACRQLGKSDSIYKLDTALSRQLGDSTYDSSHLEAMHPTVYKQLKDIFWIDGHGNWVARYGFMHYDTLPLIPSGDRQYFKDMKAGNVLRLSSRDTPFCLQPTLGKLDGTFAVNIVIPTDTSARHKAIMVGMFTEMYSVCNTVQPPGYGFSILNDKGTILFDSRQRSRLTNIYPDLSGSEAIQNSVRYRQVLFLPTIQLHGTNVAMLSTPAEGLPYTFLTYYELDRGQQFQLHVLGLFCLFIGIIIGLLILSAYCNEWMSTRTSLVSISTVSFEWLRPIPAKTGYYRHFIKGIALLAACYCIPWLVFQFIGEPFGFYLFVTSLLFPFYLTIHYVLLREKQKPKRKRLPKKGLAGAIGLPVLIIVATLLFLLPDKFPPKNLLPTLLTQIIFILAIRHSLRTFRPATIAEAPTVTLKLFNQAVVAGILLTVIVPASGIFSFFYKEETWARARSEKLAVAGYIAERADSIRTITGNYSFRKDDPDRNFLKQLRNRKGIYLPDGAALGIANLSAVSPASTSPQLFHLLHSLLFPGDTTVVLSSEPQETARDTSWFFAKSGKTETLSRFYPWGTGKDTIRLEVLPASRQSALALMVSDSVSQGAAFILLFLLVILLGIGLLYALTGSLINRIFLLRLFDHYPGNLCRNDALLSAQTTIAGIRLKAGLQTLNLDWSAENIRKY